MSLRTARIVTLFAFLSLALGAVGCATIPKGQYGVDDIEFVGMKDSSPDALAACLVTRKREATEFRLGIGTPSCGQPPFDSHPPSFDLWTLPWTDWPIYDPAIFEVERERIERWYQARGYYQAHVVDVQTFVHGKPADPNECHGSGSDCELKLVVKIDEGKPSFVKEVEIQSDPPLPAALMAKLKKNLELRPGERFDESSYEADKAAIKTRVVDASYARAEISGKVIIDRENRSARVIYKIEPGPSCVFGSVRVEGAPPDVPTKLIIQTANIAAGKSFDQETVDDAQRAVFSLRVFSSVRIEPEGKGRVVDLVITVQRGRVVHWGAGVGVMSGTLRTVTSEETNSIPQWDVHLKGTYDNRNFLGGLRRLNIEERPRLIELSEFPGIPHGGPRLGNLVDVLFEQPATFEARTKLFISAAWDAGPDPYLGFFRNDITSKVGLERPFWKHHILARIAIEHDIYVVGSNVPAGYASYKLPFLEQSVVLDLRNNPQRPRYGAYFAALVQEASRLGNYGTWDYVRFLPEARGYVPLLWDIVLAARFAIGSLVVYDRKQGIDPMVANLGPERYRLRGGGAFSDRGFVPGTLGDGLVGGTRRWEGSLELRIPLGGNLGLVGFFDTGDVHTPVGNEGPFRFSHWNAATGGGLRYNSILGALRLDAGWRIPSLAVIGGKPDSPVPLHVRPSAIHLTIGEAF